MKDVTKLNDTIAKHHLLSFIIRQFMLLILSKDQTIYTAWAQRVARSHEQV